MSPPALIRASDLDDLRRIQTIYAHHVLNGLGSFEETPPDAGELARRRKEVIDRGLPYLVAVAGERICGFAYAGIYRPRPAYRHTTEDSVYVAPDAQGRGIGRLLLAAVIECATAAGARQMIAVIGDSGNHASIALHAGLGFAQVGVFRSVGFKFGRWVDTVLMQRALGEG